jgi:hypothetical protein
LDKEVEMGFDECIWVEVSVYLKDSTAGESYEFSLMFREQIQPIYQKLQ